MTGATSKYATRPLILRKGTPADIRPSSGARMGERRSGGVGRSMA
jgi:hypothetical protein